MRKLGLVKAVTLQPFIRFLEVNGVDLGPHFRSAHIAPEMIQAEEAWVPKQQVYNFLSNVAATHQVEALGLLVGDQICVADLGRLGEEIYRCDTLEAACRCFAELVPKFAEGNTSFLEHCGGDCWFGYRTTDHRKGNRDHADHYGLMMLLSVVRLVVGYWVPREITIQTGPCQAFAEHPSWTRTRVAFDSDATAFAFPPEWLDRPIPDPPVASAPSGRQEDYPSNPPESLAHALELVLASYLEIGGVPSIQNIADSLNLSERTLKRRLAEAGQTYSGLVEQVRIRSAVTLLHDADKSVKEIAYILGYSGGNNFIRAFKRVTGQSPAAYRAP